jgi:MFS family permease
MAINDAGPARGEVAAAGGRPSRFNAVTGREAREVAPGSASGSSQPRGARARLPERRTLPGPAAFWVTVALMVLLFYASAAPTPLYGVYQAKWGFSAATLTAVFAIYVLFLLATLLVFGSLSDHVGRRPLIIAALVADVAAVVLFLAANGVGLLFAARALEGVAVGATSTTLGAVLLDLRPRSSLAPLMSVAAPVAGLAAGALGTSALVQYGPAPTRLVWWLLLGAFAAALALVAVMPEPGTRRPGALASLRLHVSVPRPARGAFARAVPAVVAVQALGGFYLSLGPSLAAQLAGSRNLLWGGAVVFLLTGAGAAAALAARNTPAPAQMLGGCLALTAGAGVTIAAIETGTVAVLLAGTGIAGLGFGPAFTGAYRTVVALAPADGRAGLIAAIWALSYLASGVPPLIAGITTTHYGLHGTALVFSAAVTGLAAAAAGAFVSRRGSRTGEPQPAAPAQPPPGPSTIRPYPPATHQHAQPPKTPGR